MTRVLSLLEYANRAETNADWLIKDLLPKPGIAVLLGQPKAGKSFLALQLALAVARGCSFLGHPTVKGSVLYLQLDTSVTVWQDRLRSLAAAGTDLTGPVYIPDPADTPPVVSVSYPEGRAWIADVVKTVNPVLAILDTLREVHNADEDSSTEMKAVGDALASIFVGRCLFLVHHTRKLLPGGGASDPIQVARGSSYITGRADAIWLLDGARLRVVSRFAAPGGLNLRRRADGLWLGG